MTKEKNGKKKTSVFWRGYVIFCLLGIAFWLLVIGYVRSCLVKYEKAQPYHLVDALLEEIRSGDVTTFFDAQQEVSPFEKAGTREDAFLESIAGKALTYRKDAGNYDVMKPVYRLYADEECIGTVTLKEVSSQPLMLILSVGQWQIAEAVPASGTEGIQVSVMAPDNCKVYINDKELGEAQLTGNEKALEQFQYSQDYVKVPKLLEYQVDGLFSEPSVRICSEDGREFECQTSREDGRIEVVADKFPASEMDEQLGAQAIETQSAGPISFPWIWRGATAVWTPSAICSRRSPIIFRWRIFTAERICGCITITARRYFPMRRSAILRNTRRIWFPARSILKRR